MEKEYEEIDTYETIDYNQDKFYAESTSIDLFMSDIKEYEIYHKEENDIKLMEYNKIKENLKLLEEEKQTEEIKSLILEAQEMLKKIKSDIVVHNTALVVSIAKRYQTRKYPLEDLIQDGCMGLMHAVEVHDASLGYSFSTYAYYWIVAYMQRAKWNNQETIRISANTGGFVNKMYRYILEYETIHGKRPSDKEIMGFLKVNEQQLNEIKKADFLNGGLVQLDKFIGEESDTTLMDIIADEENKFELVEKEDSNQFIKKLIDEAIYDKRIAYIVKDRIGYNNENKVKTLEEVGAELGITRERVRQLQERGIGKIRMYCKTKKIDLKELI